ncbi:Scavenger receptor protein, partial [Operophtera brumata]
MECQKNNSSDLKKEHQNERLTRTAPLLTAEESVVTNNHAGRILIREDTILTNLNGCAGCGRGQFTCTSVRDS